MMLRCIFLLVAPGIAFLSPCYACLHLSTSCGGAWNTCSRPLLYLSRLFALQEMLEGLDAGGVRAADNTLVVTRQVDEFEELNLFGDALKASASCRTCK